MIGFVCKYTPIELFEAMGEEVQRISPEVTSFVKADTYLHPNLCSYAKGALEDILDKKYDGIVLTACCDSIRRLYDVVKELCPDKFVYILDIPRIVNDFSISIYEKRIREMWKAYEEFTGKTWAEKELEQALKKILEQKRQLEEKRPKNRERKLRVGVMGARASKSILKVLEEQNAEVLFNLTCTGISRDFQIDKKDVFHSYADRLLNQIPCMRMEKAVNREEYVKGFEDQLDGIIYHTVQFCDSYSYEYTWLKKKLDKIPVILVETDSTRQCEGQIRTRVEAFLESLRVANGIIKNQRRKRKEEGTKMYSMGIDSGSTSTNAVILDQEKKIVAFDVVRTGAKSGESAERILECVLKKANLKQEDIDIIISTGYGRVSIPFADETVTEISCHGKGAHYFNPEVRTILDIGGQDSKAIKLNEKGEVKDFVMNDKCAAGTGRFLEMMARTLEIDISELGPISLEWKEDIDISSMCSVFAESEVISLIAQNKEKCDIAHGIHKSIASKGYSLMKRVGLEGTFMMTGGVAKNPGVVKAVEEKIKSKLYICNEPEIVGAAGAALYGLEQLMEK